MATARTTVFLGFALAVAACVGTPQPSKPENGSESTTARELAKAPFVERLSSDPAAATQQRVRLLNAWRERKSYGLRTTQHSVEGTPIHLSIITQNGALSFVTDYSDDSYSTREIYVEKVAAVELRRITREESHPLMAWFPDPAVEYLRCQLANGEVQFF